MADIELVIKIPEEKYKWIKENNPKADKNSFIGIIVHGTPLPQGHGRLIDADTLKKDDEVTEWLSRNTVRTGKMLKSFSELFIKKIDATKTIIKADREVET